MKLRDELTKALVYAVEHYPAHGSYRGHLTEEEYNEIKKRGFEVNGQLIEIKGPQFLKEGHLYNPFTCSFDKEKEQCMLDNDVIIISDISEMKKLVFSKLGNDFVKSHILGDKYE